MAEARALQEEEEEVVELDALVEGVREGARRRWDESEACDMVAIRDMERGCCSGVYSLCAFRSD